MNTKKSVWQRILLSQHHRWSVWNFQIAAAMVNGCWLSKWHSLIFTLDEHESIWRPSDQATKPYLRAAFETVFKKELQNESSLNICRVVGNSFTCKVDLSVTFFLFFFSHAFVCSFFQGYLHNPRSGECSAQIILPLVEKKKVKWVKINMIKFSFSPMSSMSDARNRWECLITLMKNNFQYKLRNN